jgi:glycosyltransferase involved in cell wall biosynthesis
MDEMVKDNCKQWRVLIYCDSVDFGGHEITLIEALKYICDQPELKLYLLISRQNIRFFQALQCLGDKCILRTIPFSTSPRDVFRVLFRSPKIRLLRNEFALVAPDLIIVSQGAIGLCSCGLGAAKMLGTTTMSFLPMAHRVSLVRNTFTATVLFQEFLYRQLYKMPDFFLTICKTAVEQLEDQYSVRKERIFMHYFGLDLSRLPEPRLLKKKDSRTEKHLGLIGRVEFNQKQHDFFIKELKKNHEQITPVVIHVIGDGPDLENLKALVEQLGLTKIVQFEGWVNDLTEWYQRLDIIILPSRFEGVPLVMLEAMYWGVPVIASNIDGMKEILPSKWLYPAGNGKEMFERIGYVINNNQNDLIKTNHQRVVKCFNLDLFRKGFFESIMNCLKYIGK